MFVTSAATKDNDIQQLDIKAAFLHVNLREEIYLDIPQGIQEKLGTMYKSKKDPHGLKQAPREWNRELISFLSNDLECRCVSVDEALLICKKQDEVCFVCVYVDDILLAPNSQDLMRFLVMKICERFKVGSKGEIDTFCGMQIKRSRSKRQLHLSEPSKVERMIENFGMGEAKEKQLPICEDVSETQDVCDQETLSSYQHLVGQLLYLSTTVRPDL